MAPAGVPRQNALPAGGKPGATRPESPSSAAASGPRRAGRCRGCLPRQSLCAGRHDAARGGGWSSVEVSARDPAGVASLSRRARPMRPRARRHPAAPILRSTRDRLRARRRGRGDGDTGRVEGCHGGGCAVPVLRPTRSGEAPGSVRQSTPPRPMRQMRQVAGEARAGA